MKRFLTSVIVLLLCLCASAQKRSEILKVYNWDEVIHPQDIENFQKWYEVQTGERVKVLYQTFDSDMVAVSSVKINHDDWDVITVSANYLKPLIKEGYIQNIDTSYFARTSTPNHLRKVCPFLKTQLLGSAFPEGIDPNDYFAPLSLSFAGFFFNADKYVSEDIATWNIFHDSRFKNSILVFFDPIDCHLIATFAMNSDALTRGELHPDDIMKMHSPEDIARSERWFKDSKDQICGWDASFGFDYIARGKVDLFYSWSSLYQPITKEIEELGRGNVDFVFPKEGGFLYIDGMVIPAYAGNPKAAAYWIDYIMSPEVMASDLVDCSRNATVSDPLVFAAIQDPEKYPEGTDLSYLFPDIPDASNSHSSRASYPPHEIASRQAVVIDTEEYIDAAMLAMNRVTCPRPSLKEFWPDLLLMLAIPLVVFFSRRRRR